MAKQEQLDLLTQGVEAWNQWKAGTHETSPDIKWNLCYDADLSEADLSGTDLSGINFGLVDLFRTNFAGVNLVGACLSEAELAETNFVGAHLAGANLAEANLCAADFSNADLRNANLTGTDLSEACLQGANLNGADLSGANLSKVRFQEANLTGANFSGVYYGTYFNRAEIRKAKEAGAVVHQKNTNYQGARRRMRFSFTKKAGSQDIILYPRVSSRFLPLMGGSLLFVLTGIWILLSNPENLVRVVGSVLGILFFGLGAVIFLFQWLRLVFCPTPILVLNEEGIEYFYPSLLGRIEKNTMTRRNHTLKWKEIGVIGLIKQPPTNSFVVYASAKRWRSGWSPSIRLPQSLLPISAERLITLIQERYQAQLEAYRIESVERVGLPSSS